LRQKRQAEVVERVPEGQLALPKTFPLKVSGWITEHPVVADNESAKTQQNPEEGRHHQQSEKRRETAWGQPVFGSGSDIESDSSYTYSRFKHYLGRLRI